ncbi:YicC/YloC family endoribonuclease [Phycisphaera mikurensis]|uniref:YicC family protein n=1 Tax=Phycisphaera mikurensis (strain NBRC 102666 / KCTC 22515 / FYK2301M01) TaxID=1142394 RepID=I0IBN4_PHYMF|nr:YicC/YloC family endoribonuclease [Phycisphaera mikurensis]MBB6442799.1 uncharacterized protein (TIGR00255 family) [Phycisphaera mikurensis]BAM02672.1 hypothetical protein PSMK_05130 [Phycisphaera mikurensis NBRC 102666]
MILSMTGFGQASTEAGGVHHAVELRSLNHRFFKCHARLPDQLAGLDAELEAALRKRFARGSFALAVRITETGTHAPHRLNEPAIRGYLGQLDVLRSHLGERAEETRVDLAALLALPGVVEEAAGGRDALDLARPVLLGLLDEAADRLNAMRAEEGQTVAADLARHRELMAAEVEAAAAAAASTVHRHHDRLTARVAELLARVDLPAAGAPRLEPADLAREVALFADRCDVSEELARLRGHLDQFAEVVARDTGEPAGRTLDFLAQEMLREVNTLGAKSADAEISRRVVNLKTLIDRLKEQVQNVE